MGTDLQSNSRKHYPQRSYSRRFIQTTHLQVDNMKLFVLLLVASVVYGDWEVKRGTKYLTCSKDYAIREYSTDLASCKADAEAEGATHIYWQKGEWSPAGADWCHLYSEEERIEKVNLEFEACKTEAESLGAIHIYWQAAWQRPVHTKPLCHIYEKCNGGTLRTPAENGVNMRLH